MLLGGQRGNEILIKIRIRIKIGIGLVYTSVQMLDGPRNIARFCHFFDGFDDCFGRSGSSASSMGIME